MICVAVLQAARPSHGALGAPRTAAASRAERARRRCRARVLETAERAKGKQLTCKRAPAVRDCCAESVNVGCVVAHFFSSTLRLALSPLHTHTHTLVCIIFVYH